MKINLSLIAKGDGLDSKGNLIFDDVEGMNHKEAFRLREQYSDNVGTILVGKNDAHIIAAMADPRIDFIIPFHKSSWKESLYDALGLTGYSDYTDTQNEKPIDKDRKISNFDPSEYWDFTKTGDENAQIYLEKCREDGRVPKFPQFQGYPGYWKLLTDFKMYNNDGVGSPQTVVRPDFNMDAATKILNDYEGGHRSFPVAKDVVNEFVSEYKAQKNTTDDGGALFSLKNKNLTINSRIPYTALNGYINVAKGDSAAIGKLDKAVSGIKRGTYENDATGYRASITRETINKALYPTNGTFDRYEDAYIRNLNAMLKLPELFKKAVYVDSKPPQKAKNANKQIKEYHHFVAPVLIGTDTYRAIITAREKMNSNTLYVLRVEVLPMQKKAHPAAAQQKTVVSRFVGVPFDISIPDLVNGVKVHDYITGNDDVYTGKDIEFSFGSDTDYLAAVNRGDMETAQKMVDEAAKAAGYTEEVFHGMGGRYNTYKSGNGQYGSGVYFTYAESVGRSYGEVVDHLFVKVGKIADYDDAYKALGKRDDQTLDEFAQVLGFHSFDEMIEDWDNDPTDIASNTELMDILKSRGFEGFVDEGNDGFVLWDFDGIVRTTGNLFGGNYFGEYWVEKSHYDITDSKNRSKFYKHYTAAVLAGNEKAADKILKDMVLNGIPYDNIIAKGYQAEKKVAFTKARKLISKGKTDEAKDIVRELAKKYDKKFSTLWKSVKEEEPEETYDFKDLKRAFRRGEDTDEIEDYLVESGEFSKEAMREAIKMLTEKYK